MKLSPLGNRVLVVRDEAEEMKNGIYLPGGQDQTCRFATIVAKGPECTKAVKVGDRVMISEYVGQELDDENTDFVVVREPELVGVVT